MGYNFMASIANSFSSSLQSLTGQSNLLLMIQTISCRKKPGLHQSNSWCSTI